MVLTTCHTNSIKPSAESIIIIIKLYRIIQSGEIRRMTKKKIKQNDGDTRHSNPMRVQRRRRRRWRHKHNNKMPTKTKLHVFHSLVPTAAAEVWQWYYIGAALSYYIYRYNNIRYDGIVEKKKFQNEDVIPCNNNIRPIIARILGTAVLQVVWYHHYRRAPRPSTPWWWWLSNTDPPPPRYYINILLCIFYIILLLCYMLSHHAAAIV